MTSTSPILLPRTDRPIDPITKQVISEVIQASQALGFPLLLVGATARILLLENVYGLNAGRATYDIDFAFAVDNWEQFETLKAYLIANKQCFKHERMLQRLYMALDGFEQPFNIDLIPFGVIEHQPNKIAWPPDKSIVMNVAGYNDALIASAPIEIGRNAVINVASLPGIAILKIFAWSDRGHDDPKDAIDLVLLLRSYHEAGNQDRIYVDATNALEEVDYDIELAGAWLLGSDAAHMASPETSAGLRILLTGEKRRRLVEDMARAIKGREDSQDYAQRLLEQFTSGFTTK